MIGHYDYRLVALSVLIAVFASYAALDLAGRTTAANGRVRLTWLAGGATAMGVGIWSMHYIGMLAFSLPVLVLYDWPTVVLSLMAAVFAVSPVRAPEPLSGLAANSPFCARSVRGTWKPRAAYPNPVGG